MSKDTTNVYDFIIGLILSVFLSQSDIPVLFRITYSFCSTMFLNVIWKRRSRVYLERYLKNRDGLPILVLDTFNFQLKFVTSHARIQADDLRTRILRSLASEELTDQRIVGSLTSDQRIIGRWISDYRIIVRRTSEQLTDHRIHDRSLSIDQFKRFLSQR
jgi:hypothetical protein